MLNRPLLSGRQVKHRYHSVDCTGGNTGPVWGICDTHSKLSLGAQSSHFLPVGHIVDSEFASVASSNDVGAIWSQRYLVSVYRTCVNVLTFDGLSVNTKPSSVTLQCATSDHDWLNPPAANYRVRGPKF